MKKGFTLIELLAVIAILAIILLIAVPKIIDVLNDIKFEAFISNEKMVIKATENYLVANPDVAPSTNGSTVEITLGTLQTNNYLSTIKDPYDSSITCDGYVTATKIAENYFDYTPHLKCGTQSTISNSTEDGLVGSWNLNNNGYDYTTNAHIGTISNATATADRFLDNNSALSFNGTNSTVDVGDGAIYNLTSTGTIIAWAISDIAYPSSTTTTNYRTLVSKSNSGGVTGNAYILNWAGTNTTRCLRFFLVDGVNAINNLVCDFDFSTWHMIVATWNGSKLTLYSDGFQIDQDNQTLNAQILADSVEIGHGYTGSWWSGSIDDVRIYNRALSTAEISQLYELEQTR